MSLTFFYAILFLFGIHLCGNLLGIILLNLIGSAATGLSLGFAPFIGNRKIGGIPVSLGYLPFLGGAVDLLGTDPETEEFNLPKAFNSKSPFARTLVIGSAFWMILAGLAIVLSSRPDGLQIMETFFQGMFFNFSPAEFYATTFGPDFPRTSHQASAEMALFLILTLWVICTGPGFVIRILGELFRGKKMALYSKSLWPLNFYLPFSC